VIVEAFFYQTDLGIYFGRQGGIVITVIGFIFVLVTQFRYQILRNNFLNSLALKRSYELLAKKNRIIEENNQIIREINEDITDSINYAKRIQQAIFQFEDQIKTYLPEYFIFYRPRDIVSGDFYWFAKIPDRQQVVITAVDCTGHGVPGAFMSMLGAEILDNLVIEKEINEADKILNQLHFEIRKLLKQSETGNQDGMDMALCLIDFEKKIMNFAGARNPLVMIQNGELTIVKADKFPIGGFHNSHSDVDAFTNHTIDITTPTTFYLFSDGFQDQFGGSKGKKFMVSKFHQFLFEIHQKPMAEQLKLLEETFINWMSESNQKQVDDVLVIGVKV
jgi:serine phosphatase RsbU (regulator of sigma subunit)